MRPLTTLDARLCCKGQQTGEMDRVGNKCDQDFHTMMDVTLGGLVKVQGHGFFWDDSDPVSQRNCAKMSTARHLCSSFGQTLKRQPALHKVWALLQGPASLSQVSHSSSRSQQSRRKMPLQKRSHNQGTCGQRSLAGPPGFASDLAEESARRDPVFH